MTTTHHITTTTTTTTSKTSGSAHGGVEVVDVSKSTASYVTGESAHATHASASKSSTSSSSVSELVIGGWSAASTEISQEATLLLERALNSEVLYHESVTTRVRVLKIRSVSQQVVSGIKYRYEVIASPESASGTVSASEQGVYSIELYEQAWSSTLQVTGIELLFALTDAENPAGDATASSSNGQLQTNGWEAITHISQEHNVLLERALRTETHYLESVTTRVRVTEIRSVSRQVAGGVKYRFEVVASPASGSGTVSSAEHGAYAIELFEQTRTNTLLVTKIELLYLVENYVAKPVASAPITSRSAVSRTSFLCSIDEFFFGKA